MGNKWSWKEFGKGTVVDAILMYVAVSISGIVMFISHYKNIYVYLFVGGVFYILLFVKFGKQLESFIFKNKFKGLKEWKK